MTSWSRIQHYSAPGLKFNIFLLILSYQQHPPLSILTIHPIYKIPFLLSSYHSPSTISLAPSTYRTEIGMLSDRWTDQTKEHPLQPQRAALKCMNKSDWPSMMWSNRPWYAVMGEGTIPSSIIHCLPPSFPFAMPYTPNTINHPTVPIAKLLDGGTSVSIPAPSLQLRGTH